jgi:DnaJ-class molecular chaperone
MNAISLLTILFLLKLCISFGGGIGNQYDRNPWTPNKVDRSYYHILGVEKSASDKDIRSAYRKKAMQLHPDKGGDESEFKLLVEAYEIISDPERRARYDQFGLQGIRGSSNRFSSAFFGDMRDLFRGFAHAQPLVYNLELSLEDFFRGRTISVTLNSQKIEVEIRAGMPEGSELRGQILDESGLRRDVSFVLHAKPHVTFSRRRADLYMEIHISLYEALTGFEKIVNHIDGQEFVITNKSHEVTRPDELLVVTGLGMPHFDINSPKRFSGGQRGDLFIRIKVDMPLALSLSCTDRNILSKLLSGSRLQDSNRSKPSKYITRHTPKKADISRFGSSEGQLHEEFAHYGQFFF